MKRELWSGMKEIGWTWSPVGQHFYKVHRHGGYTLTCLVENRGKGWQAQCYCPNWDSDRDWVSAVFFDSPIAAALNAEIEQWGAQ